MKRTCTRGKAAFILGGLWLAGAMIAGAQQRPEDKPQERIYRGLEDRRFTLYPWEAIDATRQLWSRDLDRRDESTQFMLEYQSRDWTAVGQRLREMTNSLAERVYGKILADLNTGDKPALALDDVIGILDACPSDPAGNGRWIDQLGSLIKGVVRPWQAPLLVARLEQGTRLAGGRNPEQRLLAGRILMRADLSDPAKAFLPTLAEAEALPAGAVRDEILKFHGVQQARIQDLEAQANAASGENLPAMLEALQDPRRWDGTVNDLRERFRKIPPPVLMSLMRQLLARDSAVGQNLVQVVLQRMIWEAHARVADDQQEGLMQMQLDLAGLLAASQDVPEERRKLFMTAMAENWSRQAELVLQEKPEFDRRRSEPDAKPRFVAPDLLVATAPRGPLWSRSTPPLLQESVNLLVLKLQICSDNPDPALDMILELARQNPQAAGMLAQDFLHRWADLRDPRISEPIRQRFKLAPGSAIVVTPIMARKNVEGLARMMELLRRNHIVPADYERVFDAFDFCYGNADVFQVADIERVFGPVGDMQEAQFNALIRKMQDNLGTRWRSMATQQAALYNRGQEQLMEMIRKGYADAIGMLAARATRHPDEWKALASAGTLLSDWGDLEYFQELTKNPPKERARLYKEKNLAAQDYFLKACEAYARAVPGLDPRQYSVEAFTAWFNSLLGLASNGDINLSKTTNRDALTRLRGALRGLPGPAAERHTALFEKVAAARLADTAKPLPPELKFKYVASSLLVTADTPYGTATKSKLDYYDDLLSGVRVQTRVDGPNTIWRKADFGIIVSLAHSEFMGRVLSFDKYLTPQPALNNKGPVKRLNQDTVARNDFERSVLQALAPFFDVKCVILSPKDVLPRKTDQPGWQETVLAYVQVCAKDVSVDRIPPIDITLDYIDLDGPVQLPITSAETLIRLVEEKTPPRPSGDFQITQTLDLRPAAGGGMAKLTVAVSGSGLIPELDDVVDLAPLKACLPVATVAPDKGPLAKSVQSWGDKVVLTSERQWTLGLDGTPLREAKADVRIQFPAPRDTNSVVKNEIFKDEDLVPVTGAQVTVPKVNADGGDAGQEATAANVRRLVGWGVGGAGLIGAAIVAGVLIRRSRKAKARPPRVEDVFHVPEPIDAFVTVQFLRNLAASELAHFRPEQKAAIGEAISRIEQTCFDQARTSLPENELRETARRWLREAR